MRDIRVTVTARDSAGNLTTQDVIVREQETAPSVLGGYYKGGGADITADTVGRGMNLGSHTTYRSFADASIFPGWNKQWLVDLGKASVKMNYVLELKHYGNTNKGVQTFTALGRSWTVPAPTMTTQQRYGTTWPLSYGYEQVLSGHCDGLFARALQQLRTLPFAVNIQLASELDTDHEFGTTDAGKAYTWAESDARAVQATAYMVDWFKAQGVPTGTTFSVGLGGFDQSCFVRTHPESLMAKLDYLQWNAYGTHPSHTPLDRFKRPRDWTMAYLGPIAKSKPIIVAEWGARVAEIPDQAGWIRSVPPALDEINSTDGPKIVIANYFNSGWGTLYNDGLTGLVDCYNQVPFV